MLLVFVLMKSVWLIGLDFFRNVTLHLVKNKTCSKHANRTMQPFATYVVRVAQQ